MAIQRVDLTGVPRQTAVEMMRDDYASDIATFSRLDESMLPQVADIALNLQRVYPKHKAPHHPILEQTAPGKVTILDVGDIALDFDYGAVARATRQALVALAPIVEGHYRASFKYVVNNRLVDVLPKTLPPVVGVTNTALYAAKLDARADGPFHKTAAWLAGHPQSASFAYRLGPYLPLQFAVERDDKGNAYTLPTIWIGRLGTLLKARRIRRKTKRK